MANFGIFRGFSEKLFEGELPINLGLIGSDIFAFDLDALAFFARVDLATGVPNTLTEIEKGAINTLVSQTKIDGIWSKMTAIYPMVGGGTGTTTQRAAACSRNLKSNSFNGTFTATGWTFSTTGVKPNGVAYMDTALISETNVFGKNINIGFYSRTNSIGIFGDVGNFATLATNATTLYTNLNGSFFMDLPLETTRLTATNSNSQGFYLVNNSNIVGRSIFKNSSKIGSSAFVDLNLGIPPNPNFIIGAGYGGSRGSDRELAFANFGTALTDDECINFYNSVQTFQTTLSRNV
jgi:hypothetical protein